MKTKITGEGYIYVYIYGGCVVCLEAPRRPHAIGCMLCDRLAPSQSKAASSTHLVISLCCPDAATVPLTDRPQPAMTSFADAVPVAAPLQAFVCSPEQRTGNAHHLQNLHSLACQIQHNLEHQHRWTQLRIHTHSPLTLAPLPRPLVSGLPAQRLYVHPDEQVQLLKDADRARGATGSLAVKAQPEREWVLPTRLNEQWTLRRLARIFDAIDVVPPATAQGQGQGQDAHNPWRTTKRVVLATVDSDSTVVYYIMHDGVVKPRQN